jgi:hypothetical protein
MPEAGSATKFQLLLFFNIVGPFMGLTKNLGAHQLEQNKFEKSTKQSYKQ